MTRINVVDVKELVDQHLLAEHRELTRIPNCVNSGKISSTGIPSEYTLGTGHVKFFVNKLTWLRKRYNELHQECLNRGFAVTYKFPDVVPLWNQGDYVVTNKAIAVNQERIKVRMPKNARYYGKLVA
jgi:deoxyribonuclease (pyrimidine dimer)